MVYERLKEPSVLIYEFAVERENRSAYAKEGKEKPAGCIRGKYLQEVLRGAVKNEAEKRVTGVIICWGFQRSSFWVQCSNK